MGTQPTVPVGLPGVDRAPHTGVELGEGDAAAAQGVVALSEVTDGVTQRESATRGTRFGWGCSTHPETEAVVPAKGRVQVTSQCAHSHWRGVPTASAVHTCGKRQSNTIRFKLRTVRIGAPFTDVPQHIEQTALLRGALWIQTNSTGSQEGGSRAY